MSDRPTTLGALRASGWESRPVKEEVRRNAIERDQAGEALFPDVLGYEDTVLPQLENALPGRPRRDLPRRAGPGQDPHDPVARRPARRVDADRRRRRRSTTTRTTRSPSTPATSWPRWATTPRSTGCTATDRYGEKLATPDTSIADLIGEVDPIKVAEGRYLSDELTLHYGLVPRTNRGIFAINELPDLAERIQVGLLNVLEERDVQIRGYKVRLPLDVLLVASANPEDYTNRGRIITPLKDRFGSQIRTHYPLDVDTEVDHRPAGGPAARGARRQGRGAARSWPRSSPSSSQLARRSPHINQRSGVSVRLTVSNYETLVSNAPAAR